MDGLEMLRQLRRDDWGQTADVILLTNFGDDRHEDAARALGVTDFLLKTTWKLSDVVAHVKQHLAGR